ARRFSWESVAERYLELYARARATRPALSPETKPLMPLFTPFGYEQYLTCESRFQATATRRLGELHFGVRLRGWYLARALRHVRGVERILETGCSRGQMAFWLRRRFPDAYIKAIDIDPALVARGAQIAATLGARRIEFAVEDISAGCACPSETDQYD